MTRRHGVLAATAALLLGAGCGGAASFDADAALAAGVPSALLDLAGELCEEPDDDTYEVTIALLIDQGSTEALAAQAYGCADRYRRVAETNGWPIP